MSFIILPPSGLVGLPLGAKKSIVRAFFGEGFTTGRRGKEPVPYDFWPHVCVFAYYTEDDLLEAVEFASLAEVTLDDVSIFALSPDDVLRFLREHDPNLEIEEEGSSLTSKRLGVAVWTPNIGDADAQIESVMVFSDGYYDR